MKKKKYIDIELNLKNITYFFIVTFITGLVFFFMLHNVKKNNFILPPTDNKIIIVIFLVLNLIFLFISFCGFVAEVCLIILVIIFNAIGKKMYKRNFLKIQKSLNTKDFSDVSLKEYDLSVIPIEKFVCTAKLDKKGNIVYTVSLDYVAQTDDYGYFLRYFDIHN